MFLTFNCGPETAKFRGPEVFTLVGGGASILGGRDEKEDGKLPRALSQVWKADGELCRLLRHESNPQARLRSSQAVVGWMASSTSQVSLRG